MKGERFKISKPFWEDCKDFEKDFIRNSVLNNGVSVSGTKFIINKARNINPNYTEISKNAIIEDEKGNRVQITYSTEYGVRPYYVEEEGLRTKEFFTEKQPYEMSFEEWQKKRILEWRTP